jgi:hypothetical protein
VFTKELGLKYAYVSNIYVVDGHGGNIEISNIWKMALHGVLYAPEYYEQHIVIPMELHETLSCPSFSELCF